MTRLTGTLREHRSTRDAWGVGTLGVEESDEPTLRPGTELTVVGGNLGHAAPGERLDLEGELHDDPRWGRQFRIARQSSRGIADDKQAHAWLTRLDGVGPVRARRIYDALGSRPGGVIGVLSDRETLPDPLLDVEGITTTIAQTIRESWDRIGLAASAEDLEYLDGLGCSRYEANSVLALARKKQLSPRELLEREPYSLTEAKGFGFVRADRVALKAGVSRMSPARADAAVVHYVGALCSDQGHTMVSRAELVRETATAIGVERAHVSDAVDRVAARGDVVLTRCDEGRAWVHPAELLTAERAVWRLLRGAAERVEVEERREAESVAPVVDGVDVEATAAAVAELDAEAAEIDTGAVLERFVEEHNAAAAARPAPSLGELCSAAIERADTRAERVGALLDLINDQSTTEDW